MKKIKIKILAVVISAVFALSACQAAKSDPDVSSVRSTEKQSTTRTSVGSGMNTLEGNSDELAKIRAKQEMITVYAVDSANMATGPITTVIDSSNGISEMDVLKACCQNFIDQNASVSIGSAIRSENRLEVDLKADDPVAPFGKGTGKFEQLFLDCLSKSIFENFDDIKYIYFTVNGETYHSEKLKLSADKPYMTNE